MSVSCELGVEWHRHGAIIPASVVTCRGLDLYVVESCTGISVPVSLLGAGAESIVCRLSVLFPTVKHSMYVSF